MLHNGIQVIAPARESGSIVAPSYAENLDYSNVLRSIEYNKLQAYSNREALFDAMNIRTIPVTAGVALPFQSIAVSTESDISDKDYTNRAVSLNKGITSMSTPLNAFSLSKTTLNTAYEHPPML